MSGPPGRRVAALRVDRATSTQAATGPVRTLRAESGSEGAHAVLLDVDYGTYPFVTSSSCTGRGLPADRRVGVAKAYMSRVGEGPFPTEIRGEAAARLRTLGEEYGTTTGRPRRVGWLDLVALRHAVRAAAVTEIALTGIAVLQGVGALNVAAAYRLDGKVTTRFPAHAAALGRVEPVIEEVPDADALINLIEAELAPVRYVALGRSRQELVERGTTGGAAVSGSGGLRDVSGCAPPAPR